MYRVNQLKVTESIKCFELFEKSDGGESFGTSVGKWMECLAGQQW